MGGGMAGEGCAKEGFVPGRAPQHPAQFHYLVITQNARLC